MTDQNVQLAQFVDEAAIRNLIARFADSATRNDLDMFRSVWAHDGEFRIGKPPHGQHAHGVDDIVAMLERLREGLDFFIQFALPGVIEIDGNEATTRTFVHESARGAGEHYYRNHCIAFDRMRRSERGWVFVRRSFQYLWLDTGPFAGDGFSNFAEDEAA